MADVALTLFELAVKKLYSIYKHHKDLQREFQEVGNFIVDLATSSPILKTKLEIGGLNHVKNTLRKKLESARKQVEEWSSKNSDFFSMFQSGERLRKIQGVRRDVEAAMKEADSQLAVYNFQLVHANNQMLIDIKRLISPQDNKNPKPSAPPKGSRVQPSKPDISKLAPSGAQGITKTTRPRSSSTGRAATFSNASSSSKPRSTSVSRARRDKRVELYVPMDSDKQARDVVEKLEALPGVKNAIPDQTSKKVLVVPLEGVSLSADTLLQHAQLKNKFVASTLWSKRPR